VALSAFWRDVALHPDVQPHVSLGLDVDWWTPLLAHPSVKAFESQNGGYFFAQLDPLGRVWELHAAFKPAGWGREASQTLKAALRDLRGWDVVMASEVAGNWRSRPPKSFGFRPTAPFEGQFRTWILTRDAWERSPARGRME
jgi:hypothetical protein